MKIRLTILLVIGLLNLNRAIAQNQWVSQNSGTSAFLTSVYFVSADTGYVSAETGIVLKTVNGGSTWSQAGAGPSNSLVFTSEQKGFGTDGLQILSTQNGGADWASCFSNPNVSDIWDICFPDKDHGYAVGWSTDLGNYVIKTSDGGIIWDTVYKYNQNLSLFLSLFFVDSLNGYIGCDNGYLLKTTDGGSSWTTVLLDADASLNSIFFSVPDTGYVTSDLKGVFRTINGGLTWSQLGFTFPPALYSAFFITSQRGFVVGGDGFSSMTLYQTYDAGENWSQSGTGSQTLNDVFFADSVHGYAVGTNGTILKYENTIGFDEISTDAEDIYVTPNPAINYIDMHTSCESLVEIYTTEGICVKKITLSGGKTYIDLTSLPGGLYIIKSITEKGISFCKLIKQ